MLIGGSVLSPMDLTPEPQKSVQNISTSVASAIESQAYLAPGDTAAFDLNLIQLEHLVSMA